MPLNRFIFNPNCFGGHPYHLTRKSRSNGLRIAKTGISAYPCKCGCNMHTSVRAYVCVCPPISVQFRAPMRKNIPLFCQKCPKTEKMTSFEKKVWKIFAGVGKSSNFASATTNKGASLDATLQGQKQSSHSAPLQNTAL